MWSDPGARVDDVRRIAVLRPNAVGDFVFALPCLHALRAAYPDARIHYLGLRWHAGFLAQRPGPVDEVNIVPPCPGVGQSPDDAHDAAAVDAFVDAMRAMRFDLALQIYGGGLYSNPLLRRFAARVSIGLQSPDALALDRCVHYGPLQNRRLQMLEVALLVGAGSVMIDGPELIVTARDRHEAETALPQNSGERLALIQPGASDPRRRWSPQHFAVVADDLAAEGMTVAIVGSDSERALAIAVLESMRRPALDLSGRLTLSGLCGLLERASLLVSNDTGPLHLALAIGTRCVGIYLLQNLIESGPMHQHLHRPLVSARVHCPVCGAENLRQRCGHQQSFVDEVGVGQVLDAARELMSQRDS